MIRNAGALTLLLFAAGLGTLTFACGSGGSDGSANCDLVANPGASGRLRVVNRLNNGVEWYMPEYAFSASMRVGECTLFGVSNGSHQVKLTQCNIGDKGCDSTFGSTEVIDFTVSDGETYSIEVTSGMF